MQRFSQMSKKDLQLEIEHLTRKIEEAELKGMDHELPVLEQKRNIARSFLIDPAAIQSDCWYTVEGQNTHFYVEYVNGIMAWGTRENSPVKVAIPLALLAKKISKS
ncbi:DUF1811 family protein [Thermoactinomyces mirandus]|uniref:DUF1811 family protein n=1 Tax=Thermoactinomyces mirandus TaxID=2756294 RepID=A0A7W1XRW8_9BACL|nr:DUF1811 family protein [Thermoactinomyces mirandus]MBA4602163.1 DUF1811 family protein [Thermoactinomyces mirandus]